MRKVQEITTSEHAHLPHKQKFVKIRRKSQNQRVMGFEGSRTINSGDSLQNK